MAGEISPVTADRRATPDWPAPQGGERATLLAARVLAAVEQVDATSALPGAVLEGLRRLAASGDSVGVLLGAVRGVVALLVDERRAPLAGRARDAILTLLGDAADDGSAGALGAPAARGPIAADPSAAARAADVDAQVQQSRIHSDESAQLASGGPASAGPLPALRLAAPLLADGVADAAADRLAEAIDGSGWFLEAHVAQWLRGERSLAQVMGESRRLAGETAVGAMDQRGARQFEVLQRQALALAGEAWAGQPMQLEIERDRERHREAANAGDATGLFVATLSLDLPHLGSLQARIRIVERTVGVHIESRYAAVLQPALAPLHAALSARGLRVAQLEAALDDERSG